MHNPTESTSERQEAASTDLLAESILSRIRRIDLDLTLLKQKADLVKESRNRQVSRFRELVDLLHTRATKETKNGIDATVQDLRKVLTEGFWSSPHMAPICRELAARVFTGVFDFGTRDKQIECPDCETVITVQVVSPVALQRTWTKECPECWDKNRSKRRILAEEKRRERLHEYRKHTEERQKHSAAERERIRQLRAMPYADYLETDHWKRLKTWALRRARFRCGLCNAQKPLQVHHRTYERRGDEDIQDLIALCRECHEKFHDIEPEVTSHE